MGKETRRWKPRDRIAQGNREDYKDTATILQNLGYIVRLERNELLKSTVTSKINTLQWAVMNSPARCSNANACYLLDRLIGAHASL